MNRNRLMPENYAPYRTMPAFDEGITAYMEGRYENPYSDPRLGVAAQAWDADKNTRCASCATETITKHHIVAMVHPSIT